MQAVAQGQQWWTAEQIARVLRWREEVQVPWESLTEREREVLWEPVFHRSMWATGRV